MLDPGCCRGEAVLGRARCALTEAGRRCSGWCRGCGELGALGGHWGAGTPLPSTLAVLCPHPMHPSHTKAQLGPATSPAGPHPPQPPSPPCAAAMCYGPGPIYQNSGENSPRVAGALIWGQCFPWDKITLTHRPPSDGVLFSSLLQANIAGGHLSAGCYGVSGMGLQNPPLDAVTWVPASVGCIQAAPGCSCLGFLADTVKSWGFRAWESSVLRAQENRLNHPAFFTWLKNDSKYLLGVCLGQNSFFLLLPVQTTRARSAARSRCAPSAPAPPRTQQQHGPGEEKVPNPKSWSSFPAILGW